MNDKIERLKMAAEDAAGGLPSVGQVDALVAYADALEAGRDAALAAIERVRAINTGNNRALYGNDFEAGMAKALWLVKTALDGAPEPEAEWEYRGRLQSCGYVAEGYISAEHAMNGLKVELEDHPYLTMDDTAIVERARVREWLPVEGESKS